jgi:PAS domain S-box-containing protein
MGSWAFNAAGFNYWSAELFRIHGLDPRGKAPTIQEYINLVHPEDRGFVGQTIETMLADHRDFDFTKRIVRPDGKIRSVRCVGVPTAHGETFLGFVGTGIDVTEQEQLMEGRRRSEAYLAEAQRLSHTGSFGWNISTDEHFWSDETFRIFEFDPALKISLPMILERVYPQDMPSVDMAIAAANRGDGIDLEFRSQMPDGRIKYLHVVGNAVGAEIGKIELRGSLMDVTERKLAEIELRRSKAHLADAQRLSRTGSVGLERSTKRIFWSDESARIYGYPPGTEPTAELILQRSHPDDVGRLKEVLERAAQGADDFDWEHRLLMPDGSIKHLHDLAHCFSDEAGNEEIVGAIMDITDRKVAEEAIRQSEAYLAEAQALSHTGSWVWRVSGRDAVHLSDEWYRIYGFDPQKGKPSWEDRLRRIHPDDRNKWQNAIEAAIREKSNYDVEFRILLPDNTLKWVHTVGHPVLSAAGELVQFVGSSMDITARKHAEEKLKEQELELRQMLDLAPQMVAVFGPRRERLYANRVALDYLGMTLDAWRQNGIGSEIHPDDSNQLTTSAARASIGGMSYELELRVRKSDGTYRWFLANYNPVKDNSGQISRWYVACADIDDRKKAEERLQQENAALREEIDKASMFEEIVGTSAALRTVISRISKVAPSDSTVLITGETGTGKELVARAIHRRSTRSSRPFISVNCAAIPRDLVASELFGHEKGAFTGAIQRQLGRFELANGGTIFLDEVGELSHETQVALLRVLQEREFERVGGRHPISIDVRVITATNRDLEAAVASESFRRDLFYRLNVVPIQIPSLRERKDDILMLIEYFVQRYASRAGKHFASIDQKTLDLLHSYDWPGNIRELQNVIERSVILSSGGVFAVDGSWLSKEAPAHPSRTASTVPVNVEAEPRSEREIIEAALASSRGRVSGPAGAAARLRIPPSTLDHRIKALGIDKRRFKFL